MNKGNKTTNNIKPMANDTLLGVVDFKEGDIIINGYKEVWKVLISNNQDFLCRRLSDNKIDSLTKSHFTLHKP